MCQQCTDLVKKYYPELPDDHYGELLINATAFPHTDPNDSPYLENQLKELIENTDGTLGGAINYANKQTEEEMEKYRDDHLTDLP